MVSEVEYRYFLQNPAQHFDVPGSVVDSKIMDKNQKLQILKAWEDDEQRLQTATAENMSGGERDILDKVLQAKIRLKSSPI